MDHCKKRLFLPGMLGAALILALRVVAPAHAAGAQVFKGFPCRIFNASGSPVITTDSHLVVNPTGAATLVCHIRRIANPTGRAIHWNFGNTAQVYALSIPGFSGSTTDWQEVISASGQATLTAKFPAAGQAPALLLSPSVLTFGSQVGGTTSGPIVVTLTNTTGADLFILAGLPGGANPGDFAINWGSCGSGMLLPGQSCQVSFQFSPPIGALGPRSASFEFVTGAGSFFIGMSGNAVSGP